MTRYIIRRLLQAIPLLFLISIVMFTLVNVAPGGPLAGHTKSRHMKPEQAERLRRQLGLDKPLYMQYLIWLVGNDWLQEDGTRRGVLRGDFGFSFQTRRPVLTEIMDRLPNTIYLMSVTFIIIMLISIPIGIISAIKQYSLFDIVVTTISFIGQAIPEFWFGLILIIVFYATLHNPFTGEPLLPSGGMATLGQPFSLWDRIKHLILPVSMEALGWVAWYSRFLRSSMLEVINMDYIRTARAKGLGERVVLFRHALKNAAIPLVTLLALDMPYLFAGALYTEIIFSWPGMGRLYYQAAVRRDYPVLMAILMIEALLMVLANLMADIAYAYLDPRVRYD